MSKPAEVQTTTMGVRSLAQWVFKSGDLRKPRSGRPLEAKDGIRLAQAIQQQRATSMPSYAAEVSLNMSFEQPLQWPWWGCFGGLAGRADGVCDEPGRIRIEEYKAVSTLPDTVDVVDRAQAMLYAAMYLARRKDRPVDQVEPRVDRQVEYAVIYLEERGTTIVERAFEYRVSAAQLAFNLVFSLLCLQARIALHQQRLARRTAWSSQLDFPLSSFRRGQRATSRCVYRALQTDETLLLEAPTGSGKTLGVLFPAVRAMCEEKQLFYLTSRGSGAQAPLRAVRQLDPESNYLTVVELTAKDKICGTAGMPCDVQVCEFADGYYDRAPEAILALLARCFADRQTIREVAKKYRVCPFELSLDAALWSDLVIGDYNYMFDPTVRLKRFVGRSALHPLIDEAHQLAPRVRDMLSTVLDRKMLAWPRSDRSPLGRAIAGVDRALMNYRREYGEGEHTQVNPERLIKALERMFKTVSEHDIEVNQEPRLSELYFACWNFAHGQTWFNADDCVVSLIVSGREVTLRQYCLDPARYCQMVAADYGASIRFSGTVTPLQVYQQQHGFAGPAERVESPYRSEQLETLIIDDIPTYLRQREKSAMKLAKTILAVASGKPGHYLVAFPSFAYLAQIQPLLTGQISTFQQAPGSSVDDLMGLLDRFAQEPHAILSIVMGGQLSESIDFSELQLSGVCVVSLGLPPPSTERDLIAAHFNEKKSPSEGQLIAYIQPALVKILQTAGRLLRSPDDKGVICLIDDRFRRAEVKQFFPHVWRPRLVKASAVGQLVGDFWRGQQDLLEDSVN